jgi:ferredoxin-NADP reductase
MRDKTAIVLSEHRLVKEFHEYREARRLEQQELLHQFQEQHRDSLYKRSLLSGPANAWNIPAEDLERLRIQNKQLQLECFRVQQMILK